MYIEPAGLITADHSAMWHKKTLKNPIENLTDLPVLRTFDPLNPIVPPHGAWNQLPILFSVLVTMTLIQTFKLFCTNSIIGQPVTNATCYAQQQLLGPAKEQQPSW